MADGVIVARFRHSRTGQYHATTVAVPLVASDHAGHLRREAAWKAVAAAAAALSGAGYCVSYQPPDRAAGCDDGRPWKSDKETRQNSLL